MSIQAVAWALEQDLPARPKLVLVSIANHADHTTGYCWLKAETIASEAACTTRSIYRFIGGLVRNGYIRKAPRRGEDGKQRANDYWITFRREEKAWDWGANLEPDEPESEAEETVSDDAGPQDVVEPYERISYGEDDDPAPLQPAEKHAVSPGPCDSGVSQKRIAEPSKIKPEKDARASASGVLSYTPRAYRPPPIEPPQPMGAVVADKQAKMIFVFEGSRAWDAWVKVKRRETGVSCWNLTTHAMIDGKSRRGWWFPSLFPKSDEATGPPSDPIDELTQDFK